MDRLAAADELAAAQAATATAREAAAIRAFCEASIAQRERAEARSARRAPLAAAAEAARTTIHDTMVPAGQSVLALPRAALHRMDAAAAEAGYAPMPPYVRIVRGTKDRTINAAALEEAVGALTVEDFEEALKAAPEADGMEALVEAATASLRRVIRSTVEHVRLSTSLERGTRAVDVADAPKAIVDAAWALHAATEGAKAGEGAEAKAAVAALKGDMEGASGDVGAYLQRRGFDSQPIKVSGVPFKLVRKETVTRPRIKLASVGELLKAGVGEAWSSSLPALAGGSKGGAASRAASIKALKAALGNAAQKDVLVRCVVARLAAAPGVTTVKVALLKVGVRTKKADGASSDSESDSEED